MLFAQLLPSSPVEMASKINAGIPGPVALGCRRLMFPCLRTALQALQRPWARQGFVDDPFWPDP